MSDKLVAFINEYMNNFDHNRSKNVACAIGLGYMAGSLGGICQMEWQSKCVGGTFFRWLYCMTEQILSKDLLEEIAEIVKDYE